MKSKKSYRVRNWSEYNKSLVSRGSVTIWISKEALKNWHFKGKRTPGGVKKFSDLAIKACLLVKEVYGLTYRQCEGFIRSLKKFFPIEKVPHYSTLCRRTSQVKFDLSKQLPRRKGLHILIDSTGLKVSGEGEWFRKKHGTRKFSLWSKLHLALDHESQKIVSVKRSGAFGYDSKFMPDLIDELAVDINCVYGDGAYDKRICYKKCHEIGAQLIAPVQKGARKQRLNKNYSNDESLNDRDRKIDFLEGFEDREAARDLWKKVSGYHKRSLVETAMFRLKSQFGNRIRCRSEQHQHVQMQTRAFALNKMTDLGMPESYVA